MIVLRTAGEVDAFLATPLSRETEPFARRIMDRALTEALGHRRLEEL